MMLRNSFSLHSVEMLCTCGFFVFQFIYSIFINIWILDRYHNELFINAQIMENNTDVVYIKVINHGMADTHYKLKHASRFEQFTWAQAIFGWFCVYTVILCLRLLKDVYRTKSGCNICIRKFSWFAEKAWNVVCFFFVVVVGIVGDVICGVRYAIYLLFK